MTESTKIDYVSIVQDLRDEADLCRNETATDIADLLDDAASCIVAMKSQFTALRSELAAAQEARQRAEESLNALRLFVAETGNRLTDPMYDDVDNREGLAFDCSHFATAEVCSKYLDVKWQTDRAIRAEAMAESYRKDAERYRLIVKECLILDNDCTQMCYSVKNGITGEFVYTPGGDIRWGSYDDAIDAAIAGEKK